MGCQRRIERRQRLHEQRQRAGWLSLFGRGDQRASERRDHAEINSIVVCARMKSMKNHNAPRSIQEHISIQQVGTETLVYDEQRHKAFCLNEVSSIIWRLADGEHTVAQISAAASLQLKAAVNEEIVLFALEELRRDGLI